MAGPVTDAERLILTGDSGMWGEGGEVTKTSNYSQQSTRGRLIVSHQLDIRYHGHTADTRGI